MARFRRYLSTESSYCFRWTSYLRNSGCNSVCLFVQPTSTNTTIARIHLLCRRLVTLKDILCSCSNSVRILVSVNTDSDKVNIGLKRTLVFSRIRKGVFPVLGSSVICTKRFQFKFLTGLRCLWCFPQAEVIHILLILWKTFYKNIADDRIKTLDLIRTREVKTDFEHNKGKLRFYVDRSIRSN